MISFCRDRPWRGCIILLCALAAFPVVSWFVLDWTGEGSEVYPGGIVLRDSAGDVLRVSLGPGDVDCRPYYAADEADWIVRALVAAEDGTYWTHCGVRPLSIVRAACQNVLFRRRISGASTISMQTVRLIHPHPKTFWWKYKEAILAMKMERVRDKRWILSQYLNRAPFGSNFVGIEAAAEGWFGKTAKQLGLGEAALLAGMVQSPSRYRPDRALARALRRRDYVLERMLKTGVITAAQRDAARSVIPVVSRSPRPFKCPYYCDWVMRRMGKDAAAQRHSGDIVTPLDADIQAFVESSVSSAAEKGGYSVAGVVMRVDTGDVVSLACSGDYFDAASGQVNTALAPRPAGSTLKPFLAALAMDGGVVAPSERLLDAPVTFKGYRPSNFDASYRGWVTLRDALVLSLNVPFVRLLQRVGVERFGAHLRALGFRHMGTDDASFGLGMAIGNVEVTLVELVGAYAALAREASSAGGSYLVSEMLSGEERSGAALGHIADVRTSRFAWKTGTSSAYRDAWTVVWNPEYVVGVWCGHKRGGFGDRTLVGAQAAAPVAWTIARSLYPQDDGPWFAEPEGIVRRRVCVQTGRPANASCPCVEDAVAIRGRSSPIPCDIHRFDLHGRTVEKTSRGEGLAIIRPEPHSRYVLVEGTLRQKIVCRVAGNPAGAPLWWFVDGRYAGMTEGASPFVLDLVVGEHTVRCSTADAITAEVFLVVEDEARTRRDPIDGARRKLIE